MKAVYFDSVGGASGDMVLSALIGLGADRASIQRLLATLDIGPFEISCVEVREGALAGLRVTVELPHTHGHAPHRRLADIRGLIDRSAIPEDAKGLAIRVFERLARAEAHVHGTGVEDVHFHEVGAVDSIVDIVGSCVALKALGVDRVGSSPLPMGSGWVQAAHGRLPVPAPATVELMNGFAIAESDEPFELVTPTGAALLTTWQQESAGAQSTAMSGRLLASSCAFGHRTLRSRPNVLRARLLELAAPGAPADECLVLECNLDDTVPELIGALLPALLRNGALDAFTTPVQMKKQRPGCLLTVLCRPEQRDSMVDLVFAETTTFGIREHLTRRAMLDRRHVEVATPYGSVRVKIGSWKGRDIVRSPEHDDCARRAEEHSVPVRAVYEAAARAL